MLHCHVCIYRDETCLGAQGANNRTLVLTVASLRLSQYLSIAAFVRWYVVNFCWKGKSAISTQELSILAHLPVILFWM